jgi:hypothetical protein
MLTGVLSLGFTGHRAGFDPMAVREALGRVLDELGRRAAAAGGEVRLLTGIAEGSDTVCAQVARGRGMEVHLLLPLEEAEFARDFSPGTWELSAAELAKARARPGRDSVRLVGGATTRPECYVALGDLLLREIDLLVAVSDGAPSRGPGGTAAVIEKARAAELPVVVIEAATGAVTMPEELDGVFRLDALDGRPHWAHGSARTP